MIGLERVILHCDANYYYAAVECLYRPELRSQPVAVCGDPAARHGIILTKNTQAKAFGVRTGEAIWQAREKCPGLVCVPADFPLYVRFSRKMRAIYEQDSNRVESFGLDECWIDLTNPGMTLQKGKRIADEIRGRVREELGITISVGTANNKIFAKHGSDRKKPDATTLILPDHLEETVFPLPASDLLFVGPSTSRKLASLGILTIGDLARCDEAILHRLLGKNGPVLKRYASGLDTSPVMACDQHIPAQSIGNSITPPHDLTTMDDVRCLFYLLAESVGARLRADGVRARCISISLRDAELVTRSCQLSMPRATSLTDDLAQTALQLFSERFSNGFPYRSIGLSCSQLTGENEPVQLDFMGDESRRICLEKLERSIDSLRRRYGQRIITRGVVMADPLCAVLNPVDDHQIHPVPFYAGREGA